MICYIYSYLKIRKQCVTVNNIKGSFVETISRVLQGSVVVPILFNIFFNDFFYKYLNYFTDDNTLSSFAKKIENLISILESKSEIGINWFKDNHMIVNLGNFTR